MPRVPREPAGFVRAVLYRFAVLCLGLLPLRPSLGPVAVPDALARDGPRRASDVRGSSRCAVRTRPVGISPADGGGPSLICAEA